MDRYEEALERAKAAIEVAAYPEEVRRVAETIFPELRESEDERIRKALVKHFRDTKNCVGDIWAGMDVDSILAWLEKQKEQKPTLVDKLRSISTPADENWFEIQKKWEKEDEQKPAEWSEEDENNIGWLVAFLQGETGSGDVIGLMKESLISWLKSLRPQPKQEENIGKELLYVAEKQYERGKKDGYREGFDEGYKKANEAMSFHYDMSHNSTPCYAPGGVCTNPQMDCINCPKKTTGGSFTVTTKSDEK